MSRRYAIYVIDGVTRPWWETWNGRWEFYVRRCALLASIAPPGWYLDEEFAVQYVTYPRTVPELPRSLLRTAYRAASAAVGASTR